MSQCLCYPRTAAEIAAGITPAEPSYPPGDVRRYGALGDGVANDAPAIQLALNGNPGTAILLIPGATHRCDAGFSVPLNTDIIFNRATLDFSAVTAASPGLISGAGSLGAALGELAVRAKAGDVSITLDTAPTTLSPGDLVVFRNETDYSWNADREYYRQGEFLVVKAVSGAIVTFSSALLDTYELKPPAPTPTEPIPLPRVLCKVTATSMRLAGPGTIRGNPLGGSNSPTVHIRFGHGCTVEGITFRNTISTCVELIDCYEFRIQVDTGKYLPDTTGVESSGVIAGGQRGHVYDSILHGSRHGGATGGGGVVVSRFVIFQNCDVASRQNYAADFHGGAERCGYYRCRIDGGVNLSGDKNEIVDCDIAANSGPLVNMEANRGLGHKIQGNRFSVRATSQYVLDANAATDINAHTTQGGTFVFKDNEIIDATLGDISYIFIRNNGSAAKFSLEVTGNTVRKAAPSFGNLLFVDVVSGSSFERLSYFDQIHVGTGFGIVSGIDTIALSGSLGTNPGHGISPSFGNPLFEPSEFWFEKTLDLASAAPQFPILAMNASSSFVPLFVSARADTEVTATNGQYFSVGVDADTRRASYGSSSSAAASAKHSKNSRLLFHGPALPVLGGEVLRLLSTATNAGSTALGDPIGGADQFLTVRIRGHLSTQLPNLP